MGLFDKTVASSVKFMPKAVVKKVASRYVAGETLELAVQEARRLNDDGCIVTLDLLGESIADEEHANASADTYLDILAAIADHEIDGNVSIKPTHFGLGISVELFERNLRRVLAKAGAMGNFVRIDMEDSPYTDKTLGVHRKLREEGIAYTGTVLQAMLHRTQTDLESLDDLGPNLRLCKGVYREPPEVAYQSYDEVNASFIKMLEFALARRNYYIGIATHDDTVIEAAERIIKEHDLDRDQYEFQMLLGVRQEIRKQLVDRGHRVRVYCPFGTEWYAYCIRRLKENPKFAGFVTKDVLKDPTMLLGTKADKR